MIKGKEALPKYLFYIATQIEKDRYTLIEKSAHLVVKNWHLLTPYSCITSSQSV